MEEDDDGMRRLTLALSLAVLLGSSLKAAAWNKSGHMLTGAIAYKELAASNPAALAEVVRLLKTHPEYQSRWVPMLEKDGVAPEDQDMALFMFAARWPDDIRGDRSYDHPTWHYVNFAYRPPSKDPGDPPAGENILTAYRANLDIVKSTAPDSEKAVALCWIFHLIGDVHQPLHTTAMFGEAWPNGDRGGNLVFVRATETSSTINLHSLWDGLMGRSENIRTLKNEAIRLRSIPELARGALPELSLKDFNGWAKPESFDLAVKTAYLGVSLPANSDRTNGGVVPDGYLKRAKEIGTRRVVLAGYRIANVLAGAVRRK